MRPLAIAILFTLALVTTAHAMGGDPLPEPTPKGTPHATGASVYNQGLALADAGDFVGAEAAYRQAIALDPTLPEAWNGLGHSLKKQKRYQDSLAAYDEALRLRPGFPLAMQYLGELYVEIGDLDKARDILAKLTPIDQENALKLANAIYGGGAKW